MRIRMDEIEALRVELNRRVEVIIDPYRDHASEVDAAIELQKRGKARIRSIGNWGDRVYLVVTST